MTACKDCENLYVDCSKTDSIVDYDPNSPPVWYQCRCTASPKKPEFNPLTGISASFHENGYEGYQFCREINKGDCPKFKAGKNNLKGN